MNNATSINNIFELIVKKFDEQGVILSSSGEELLKLALQAQIDEGIVENQPQLLDIASRFSWADLSLFCNHKFGKTKLGFCDTLELFANLHDRWILARRVN